MKPLMKLFKANANRGTLRADAKENAIYLYDMICGDSMEAEWFGGTSPKQFVDLLATMNGDVALHINSPGGDVFGGQAIAAAIRGYSGKVTAYIDGVAASIASIIAVTCDKVVMAPGSMMMVHKAWTIQIGNSEEMMETASLLNKIDGLLAQSYATKAGGDVATFTQLMADESWLTPDECVASGLCDEISEAAPKAQAKWDLSAFEKAPKQDIEALVNERAAKLVAEIEAKETLAIVESEHRARKHRVLMLTKAA